MPLVVHDVDIIRSSEWKQAQGPLASAVEQLAIQFNAHFAVAHNADGTQRGTPEADIDGRLTV